jgi:hypothetical protein
MKVSSPVGDLPFEAKHLRWKDGTVVLEGAMGAWPARVVIYPKDAPRLISLMKWPLIALAGIVLVAVLLVLASLQ